jgi:hypothetical protein
MMLHTKDEQCWLQAPFEEVDETGGAVPHSAAASGWLIAAPIGHRDTCLTTLFLTLQA